jgi:hypothetical protein
LGARRSTYTRSANADQQGNQPGKINRLVTHQPMQKRHDPDADHGRDQAAKFHAFMTASGGVLFLLSKQFYRVDFAPSPDLSAIFFRISLL